MSQPPADAPAVSAAVDPDPFTIAIGIFGAAAAGGAFLETRRQRQALDRREREEFRGSWYDCRRSVVYLKRNTDEFETYLLEEGFGRRAFKIGIVRLVLGDEHRQRGIRRLQTQVYTTAHVLADNMDRLSNFLGPEDRPRVEHLLSVLQSIQLPERYSDVLRAARTAVDGYSEFLDEIDEREGFTSEEPSA